MEGLNPKDAAGRAKPPISAIPPAVLTEIGIGFLEGELKYGRFNFLDTPALASVYYDALHRHVGAWYMGQDIDPASGIHHLSKGVCSLIVMRAAILNGSWTDDRPPPVPPDFLNGCQRIVEGLHSRYRKSPIKTGE